MSGVCVLAPDINQCPNYNADIGAVLPKIKCADFLGN